MTFISNATFPCRAKASLADKGISAGKSPVHEPIIDYRQIGFLASEIVKYGLFDPYLDNQSLVRIGWFLNNFSFGI